MTRDPLGIMGLRIIKMNQLPQFSALASLSRRVRGVNHVAKDSQRCGGAQLGRGVDGECGSRLRADSQRFRGLCLLAIKARHLLASDFAT